MKLTNQKTPTPLRSATIIRNTNETQIELQLNLDGTGVGNIVTPIGFLNHMLELFAKHSLCDLRVTATGDTWVDEHHIVEDIGIVLGQALVQAVGQKRGISRYGFFILPMDETLSTVALDLAGRTSFCLDCQFTREKVGDLSTELVTDFWVAFANEAKVNLLMKSEYGRNAHHQIEGLFKATARALRQAVSYDQRALNSIPSTKGSL